MIASIILCASLIIGVLAMTGLGVKITSLILSLSGDSSLPNSRVDSTCVSLPWDGGSHDSSVCDLCFGCGPALIDQGLDPLIVHLFVFGTHSYQPLPHQSVEVYLLLPVWLKKTG